MPGKLQIAKNRKHYCRPVLKSCDFHFGVGHSLEQRVVPGPKAKGALFQKAMCTLVLKLMEFAIVCVCGNLKKKIDCDSCTLAGFGVRQPRICLLRWVWAVPGSGRIVKKIMKSDACLQFLDLRAAEQHKFWCNQAGVVSVERSRLAAACRIFHNSWRWSYFCCENSFLGVAPFALAAAIQAPLGSATFVCFRSEICSLSSCLWPRTNRKKKNSASLDPEQAMRLVNRAIKWQDSDCIPGVMIAKDGWHRKFSKSWLSNLQNLSDTNLCLNSSRV